jgi:hypothetical protein
VPYRQQENVSPCEANQEMLAEDLEGYEEEEECETRRQGEWGTKGREEWELR